MAGRLGKAMKEFMQKPMVKKAVDTVFPDPMNHYKVQDMMWDFKKPGTLDQWISICDSQFGGKSYAELVPSPNGMALFRGNLSTEVPIKGDAKYSGVCAIRSQPRLVRGERFSSSRLSSIYSHP